MTHRFCSSVNGALWLIFFKQIGGAGLSGCLGTLNVCDSRGRFHGVVATWLGASTHGATLVLVTTIVIAVDDGNGGNEARKY